VCCERTDGDAQRNGNQVFARPLALRPRGWHDAEMEPVRRNTRAGGAFFALALVVGMAGGIITRQPSIGLLVGAAVGVIALVLVWALDR
jgi:hypothetical protein